MKGLPVFQKPRVTNDGKGGCFVDDVNEANAFMFGESQ